MTTTEPVRLFVYGTLREGQPNHRLLVEVKATRVARKDGKGDVFATMPAFKMIDLGSYPAVLHGGDVSITGEVFELPGGLEGDELKRIDRLEGHPTYYKREVIRLDDGSSAWMYIMPETRKSDRDPEVSSGNWIAYLTGAEDTEPDGTVSMGARTTYFAFGSNLVLEQMEKRCPSAVLLTTARLRGHRLEFVGWSPTWKGGVATVVPMKGQEVVGAVWSISMEDLAKLDRFEGHPWAYVRMDVAVIADDDGSVLRAWTYRLRRAAMAPSAAYLEAVHEGRKQLGLHDADVLDAAVRAHRAEQARAKQVDWPKRYAEAMRDEPMLVQPSTSDMNAAFNHRPRKVIRRKAKNTRIQGWDT